jgi:hypothetical protein
MNNFDQWSRLLSGILDFVDPGRLLDLQDARCRKQAKPV